MASEIRFTPEADADILLNLPPAGKYWVFLSSARSDYFYKVDSAGNITSATNALVNPMTTAGDIIYGAGGGTATRLGAGANGQVLTLAGGIPSWATPTVGTVTSVAQSFTGGLISVGGSPITTSGTLALTVAGTSGGIPYFSSGTTWASSGALTANALVIGGGAGVAPSTTTTGTGVLTALGVNVGSAGAFVTFNGALGTPSSGTLTNATGLPISTGVSGLGANVATFLATPSSANLAAAVTDETGTGALVFANTPTLVTPVIGAATGTSLVLSSTLQATVGTFTAASSLVLGTASTNTGGITFKNSTNANNVIINSGVTSASYTLTLPLAQGAASTVLTNDGTGVLSWAAASGGSGVGDKIFLYYNFI